MENQIHAIKIGMLNYQANNFKWNFLFDTQFTNSLYSGPSNIEQENSKPKDNY